MDTHPSLLEVRNVTRRFGACRAVDSVSLSVEAGEFFTLVGTSGCGKSTLLRMIAGFDTPDSGEILFDGRSLAGLRPEDRPTNMVFQSYALFPHLTVAQNVAFPLRMAGVPKHKLRSRVTDVLDHVALADKAGQYPHELSGGQRQRVALARAIAVLPRLLLLDEPLAALDPKLREKMQVELIRLQRTLGITFILVTHSQAEALALSHRIGVMANGRIVQVDEPAQIYGAPKNRLVADFIGNCTLVEATVTAVEHNGLWLATKELGHIIAPMHPDVAVGRVGWLALRPEQLRIGRPGHFTDLPNRVAGKVCDFLYGGDVTTYIVELANGWRMEALLANTSPGRVHFFEIGEAVELAWAHDVGRYLDD